MKTTSNSTVTKPVRHGLAEELDPLREPLGERLGELNPLGSKNGNAHCGR